MNTPVLLIHFNRPACTRQQIVALERIRPRSVTVLCDGPRVNSPGEDLRVNEVRRQFENLPWACNIKRIYRDENLGVSKNISKGISEFFSLHEEGIILEDDCIPSASFFHFCESMLSRYKTDNRVVLISGHLGGANVFDSSEAYGFSNYFSCWGWATWRRGWEIYEHSISEIGRSAEWKRIRNRVLPGFRQRLYWDWILLRLSTGKTDSWAYRLQLCQWRDGGLTVFPSANLIENTGFNHEATNTSGLQIRHVPAGEVSNILRHPSEVKANKLLDKFIEDNWHSKSLPVRFRWMLAKLGYLK